MDSLLALPIIDSAVPWVLAALSAVLVVLLLAHRRSGRAWAPTLVAVVAGVLLVTSSTSW